MFSNYSLKFWYYFKKQRFNKTTVLNILAFYLLNASTIYANDNYIDEDSLFDDVETVVSATRLKQKITNRCSLVCL